MKNTSLILCILAMMGAISCKNAATTESAAATETAAVAATEGKIVYIDLDRILMEYDMANDLRSSRSRLPSIRRRSRRDL